MTVIAYHLIWTNYGTWLPNDLRGSGSRNVYTPILAELGESHLGRRKVQPRRNKVHEFYAEAEPRLKFDVIRFDQRQINSIGESFTQTVCKHQYTCYASAVMPDHVHVVIRKHKHDAESMIENVQGESRAWLIERSIVPVEHPVWTKKGWHVFLDEPPAVWGRIRYVESNPTKEGLARQHWPFVVAYDNWPFHKRR